MNQCFDTSSNSEIWRFSLSPMLPSVNTLTTFILARLLSDTSVWPILPASIVAQLSVSDGKWSEWSAGAVDMSYPTHECSVHCVTRVASSTTERKEHAEHHRHHCHVNLV